LYFAAELALSLADRKRLEAFEVEAAPGIFI